jgi:small nuclear ribonucleoprotein E
MQRNKVKKPMTLPINLIFKLLQEQKRVTIWLYEDTKLRIEGKIIGFDEYMNVTLDDAKEIDVKTGESEDIGRILLKGDTITLIQEAR